MKYKPTYLASLAVSVLSLFAIICPSAQGSYIATLDEVGSNVVGTGSGSLDVTSLTLFFNFIDQARTIPMGADLLLGPSTVQGFGGAAGISGPTSFGSGLGMLANTGAGNFVGVNGHFSELFVPLGYTSGTALGVSTATWSQATFASLGLTPGTYIWTWGSGMHADSFTLQIGPAGVPDAGSTVSLLGSALLGLAALRRKLAY